MKTITAIIGRWCASAKAKIRFKCSYRLCIKTNILNLKYLIVHTATWIRWIIHQYRFGTIINQSFHLINIAFPLFLRIQIIEPTIYIPNITNHFIQWKSRFRQQHIIPRIQQSTQRNIQSPRTPTSNNNILHHPLIDHYKIFKPPLSSTLHYTRYASPPPPHEQPQSLQNAHTHCAYSS